MRASLQCLGRQLTRAYSTAIAQALTLDSISPFIRPLAGPSSESYAKSVGKDFLFWPNFLGDDESIEVLKMALWRLDRSDSSLRRRRKGKAAETPNQADAARLQELFDQEYGFEEVGYGLGWQSELTAI